MAYPPQHTGIVRLNSLQSDVLTAKWVGALEGDLNGEVPDKASVWATASLGRLCNTL